MAITIPPLPPYPSTRARASLTPSQASILAQNISNALSQILSFPDTQITTPATLAFLSSYLKDAAQQALHALTWGFPPPTLSPAERKTKHAVFILSERLASLSALDLSTLVDLGVAYARVSPARLTALFSAAFSQSALADSVRSSALPALTALLSTQGIYALRKTAHVILSFLRPAPPEVLRLFARSRPFVRAIATAYDAGLSTIAQTYGGLGALAPALAGERAADEWERLFLETKVALLDTFHILVRTLLADVAAIPHAGPALTAQAEPAFAVLFELSSITSPVATGAGTPFLDRPLLADYQHVYDLARTLRDVLRRAEDARTDLLEASIREMASAADVEGGKTGALRLLLRSSGAPPGIDRLGRGPGKDKLKGKQKDVGMGVGQSVGAPTPAPAGQGAAGVPQERLDSAVSQVLELLPDEDPDYVRYVLAHADYSYKGDAERLIGALLEGTAPDRTEVHAAMEIEAAVVGGDNDVGDWDKGEKEAFRFTQGRRNVWDEDVMDLSKVRIGKKTDDAHTMLEDRSFIEQMKADILRRAEEVSDSEDEEEGALGYGQARGKGKAIAFEDELDEGGAIKVRDGDASDEEDPDEEEPHGAETPQTPETILELAYIQNAAQFERDAQTRRSAGRAKLKAQTGWTDEQIEGWKIMLERDPKKKERMLTKHEWTGNRPLNVAGPQAEGSNRPSARGGQGARGRGRGRGRGGRGGGAAGGGGEGGGGNDSARGRAWKERRGNRDRKRGHDKKMARVGGPS